MNQDVVVSLAMQAMQLALKVGGPILMVGLVIGLAISIFQAVTQIQEQTLTFVPKMVVIFGALAALGPWLGSNLLRFTQLCFEGFPKILF